MEIVNFAKEYVAAARTIALLNYQEEQKRNAVLPKIEEVPDLTYFIENGIGVVALDNGNVIGFLCFYKPWKEMFGTHAGGTFSPMHAHGSVEENRELIYQKMYEKIAESLVAEGAYIHSISLYAGDVAGQSAFFTYGFGNRCMDAIREMKSASDYMDNQLVCSELPLKEFPDIRQLRSDLNHHLTESPCFFVSVPEDEQNWLDRVEKGDRRTFAIKNQLEKVVAYIDVSDEGETFITEMPNMINICGAYCIPEYRGSGAIEYLLNYVINTLKEEGYSLLGVDYESFNPTALRFWRKHFTPYTRSLVRRIDECFKD